MADTDHSTVHGSTELGDTHARLLVDEFAACVGFYRDVSGFGVTFGDEESGYADLRTDGTTIALFDSDEMAAPVGTDDVPTGRWSNSPNRSTTETRGGQRRRRARPSSAVSSATTS
jgi:catechol 2,3-dioxygenase-like lactoylglutathione lyase family enzyme